ncbi:MAG: hypothetical protein HY347_09715 [candidate division NC10 bacterium]|nr:hypothetical protein [candidate division NC10 bacterium]
MNRKALMGAILGLLLPALLLAGEEYAYEDDVVEVIVEKLDEEVSNRPLLDITLTNKSDKPLTQVLLELKFYDASKRLVKKAEIPVFAFQNNIGRVRYVAPPFARVDVGPVHYMAGEP